MLFERQRGVKVIDFSRATISAASAGEPSSEDPRTQMIAAGLVVDEADDLETEFTMFEDAIGDDAAEIPCAGDQDRRSPRRPSAALGLRG